MCNGHVYCCTISTLCALPTSVQVQPLYSRAHVHCLSAACLASYDGFPRWGWASARLASLARLAMVRAGRVEQEPHQARLRRTVVARMHGTREHCTVQQGGLTYAVLIGECDLWLCQSLMCKAACRFSLRHVSRPSSLIIINPWPAFLYRYCTSSCSRRGIGRPVASRRFAIPSGQGTLVCAQRWSR